MGSRLCTVHKKYVEEKKEMDFASKAAWSAEAEGRTFDRKNLGNVAVDKAVWEQWSGLVRRRAP